MNIDRRLLMQARAAGWALGLIVLSGLLTGLLVVGQASLLSRLIGRVFLEGQSLAQVQPLFAWLLAVFALRALLALASEVGAGAVAARVKVYLRAALVEKLFNLGPAYAQGERSGELTAAAVQGVEALEAYFSQFLPQMVLAGLVPLTFLAVVFPLDWVSGLVMLLTAPLIPIFMALIGKASESLTQRQWTALSRMSAFFLDTLQGLTTLKQLGQSRAQSERIRGVSERYRRTTMSVLRVTFLSALVLELVGTLSTAVIAVEIGLRLLYGQMQFEQAFLILLVAPEFYLPLRLLGLRFHAGMAGVSAARKIFEVLDAPLPAPAPANRTWRAKTHFTKLEFREVNYTYPGRGQEALCGLSFVIRAGEQTALVGASGAGKSTVSQLLLGFIHAQGGQILVDGLPLEQISLESWRESIAWVPQQPTLFNGTIAENLRIAAPGAALEELRRAARQAELDDFIQSLPLGYETPVGELGARLSGGQAQRLALARAFLKDAPFVILDEPTAHLDAELEAALQTAGKRLRSSRTALIIAHRLPTVVEVDQIVLLEQGRAAERGTHAELLARGGAYARLVRAYGGGE